MFAKLKLLSTFILVSAFSYARADIDINMPDSADTLEILPLFIHISPPLSQGEHLMITNNTKRLIDFKVDSGQVRFISTRLAHPERGNLTVTRMNNGKAVEQNHAAFISERIAEAPATTACTEEHIKNLLTKNGELKLLLESTVGFDGEITFKDIGFQATLIGSKLLPRELYFQMKGSFSSNISPRIENPNKCNSSAHEISR